MNCEKVAKAIPLYFYGELPLAEEEQIEDHLEGCAPCRAELERQKALAQVLDRRELEPPVGLLAECSHDLMRAVYREEAPARERSAARAWPMLQEGFRALLGPVWRWRTPVAGAALLALGFVAARLTQQAPMAALPAGVASETPVLSMVRSVQPEASGKVQIAVDETRRRIVSGSLQDRQIQRLLLAAARDESNPGVRVESVDLLKDQALSREVRGMLLYAVARDPNPGVRLKALEGLKPYAAEPDVRKVLAQVLLKDDNPGVRIQAIDMLTAKPDDSMVGVLQHLVQKENNSYVRRRIEQALETMNASVGTF